MSTWQDRHENQIIANKNSDKNSMCEHTKLNNKMKMESDENWTEQKKLYSIFLDKISDLSTMKLNKGRQRRRKRA